LLLSGVVPHQDALALLKPWVADQPDNLEISLTYAQLLSYRGHYGEAIHRFQDVLRAQPDEQKAWVGLGYSQLWSGLPLAAKQTFLQAVQTFPDAYDVLMGLAESEKALGRNDRALERLKELQNLNHFPSQSYNQPAEKDFKPVAYWHVASVNPHPIIWDVSVLPPDVPSGSEPVQPSSTTVGVQLVMDDATLSDTEILQRDLDALQASLKALDAMQQRTDSSLQDMNTALSAVETISPEVRAVQAQLPVTQQLQSWNTQPFSNGAANPHSSFLQIPLMLGGDPAFAQSRYYGKEGLAPGETAPPCCRGDPVPPTVGPRQTPPADARSSPSAPAAPPAQHAAADPSGKDQHRSSPSGTAQETPLPAPACPPGQQRSG
jgi:tetratricopeptide (TPR) repeat protein